MARRATRTMTTLGVVAVAAGLLAGCAGAAEPAAGSAEGETIEVGAAWLDDGRLIAVTTRGSSTCVPTAEDASVDGAGVLQVTLVDGPEDQACTRDMAPRASLVGVPDGVDPADDLEISVSYADASGETVLVGVPGLAGPGGESDFAPSAGWVAGQGSFAFVTWGSSSCPPVVESVEATEGGEIVLTFATPEPDQVCTMDMAPRGGIASVGEIAVTGGEELVLQGDLLDGTRVPILGAP